MRYALLFLAACAAQPRPVATPRRLGDAMVETAMRFQRAGRAVLAGRWELAAYDIHELEEVFGEDLAASPWQNNPKLPPLAQQFHAQDLAALKVAVRAHDRVAFETAVAHAAQTCNGCHKTADMAYIEIPTLLGEEVPVISADRHAEMLAGGEVRR